MNGGLVPGSILCIIQSLTICYVRTPAIGIWVWSSASAQCAEMAIIYVFLKPVHTSNSALRTASLVLYVIAMSMRSSDAHLPLLLARVNTNRGNPGVMALAVLVFDSSGPRDRRHSLWICPHGQRVIMNLPGG
jgi:hypothetical protein